MYIQYIYSSHFFSKVAQNGDCFTLIGNFISSLHIPKLITYGAHKTKIKSILQLFRLDEMCI